MKVAAHNLPPKQHRIMDRLRDAKGRLLVIAALGTASLVATANFVNSDSSSKAGEDPVSTHTAKDHETKTSSTVIDKVPETVAPTEIPQVSAIKPAVVKPKVEKTQPTQTSAVEREASALEKAEALGRASTVQIRFQSHNNTPTYDSTIPSNTATHIGNGILIDTAHSTREQEFGPDGRKKGIYDIASLSSETNSIWSGSGPGQMTMKGKAKGIVVNGDNSQPDFRLLYAPEAANMPSMKLAKEAPNVNEDYFITGYPRMTKGKQMQFPAKFLAEATYGDFNVPDETGKKRYTQGDAVKVYLFGVPKDVPNAESACTLEWSGGGVGNIKGETMGGGLAAASYHNSAGIDDALWQAARSRNPNTDNMQVICGYQVADQAMVDAFRAKIGQPNP